MKTIALSALFLLRPGPLALVAFRPSCQQEEIAAGDLLRSPKSL